MPRTPTLEQLTRKWVRANNEWISADPDADALARLLMMVARSIDTSYAESSTVVTTEVEQYHATRAALIGLRPIVPILPINVGISI